MTIIVMKNKTTSKIMTEILLNVMFGSSGAYFTFFRNLDGRKGRVNKSETERKETVKCLIWQLDYARIRISLNVKSN